MCNRDAAAVDPAEGNMVRGASASPWAVLRKSRRAGPETRLDTFCTRTGRPRERPSADGPAGEGLGRTARMHVSEESDSGVVPMNHSNKGRPPLAESEEGRPLVKENTHPPHTRPTPSGARVSQGLMGVRSAEHHFAATYPRQEPYALTSARTDLCGGCRVTGIPTATCGKLDGEAGMLLKTQVLIPLKPECCRKYKG